MSSNPLVRLTRRAVLMGALAGLAACGFQPLNSGQLQNSVAWTLPDSLLGYHLGAQLGQRLGQPAAPRYELAVTLSVTEDNIAIADSSASTRVSLHGVADYVLSTTEGVEVTRGAVDAFTGYSTTGNTVATRAAAEDAQVRLATMLADLMVPHLLMAARP